MSLHDFIFTKQTPYRYYRHILFWLIGYTHYIFGVSFNLFSNHVIAWKAILVSVGVKYFIVIFFEMVYTYIISYWLLPKHLSIKHYLPFVAKLFVLTITVFIIMSLLQFWYSDIVSKPFNQLVLPIWFYTGLLTSAGPPVVCGLFLSIKILKNYYKEMEEKIILVKENAEAEMQLLKAQVHPHFLFNTLNNIYSFTLNKSPRAGGLVLKLSDTLKYMINDCAAASVPLEKELKMIKDYIVLENVRYGSRLNMQIEIKGNYPDKLIAPLLMIPFVENAFKHGASKMLEHPWIKLFISIEDNVLHFDLSNSMPLPVASFERKNGIGLKNVQKRLHILYPGQYILQIESTQEVFSVHMQMPLLQKNPEVTAQEKPHQNSFELSTNF